MQGGGGLPPALEDEVAQRGLTLSVLFCLGIPLLLLLLGAGLTAAFAAGQPLLALVGLFSMPALALGAERRIGLWLAKAPQHRRMPEQTGEGPKLRDDRLIKVANAARTNLRNGT